MPGPGNLWLGGPLQSGTKIATPPSSAGDIGTVLLQQDVTLTQNGSTVVDATMLLPGGSQIIDIVVDNLIVWNSATSDTLSVGTTSGGTQYASGVDVKAAAVRIRPTFTGAQLLAMQSVGTATPQVTIHVTVTPVGAATTGSTVVGIVYQQTVQATLGSS